MRDSALLAVLLLLFCPVRYQARAVKEAGSFKETELEARITWLFHAIGARFFFHDGEGKLVILLFGVSLETIKGWLKKLKGGRRKNSVSQTSRSKAKKRKKKSAQTKGISQDIWHNSSSGSACRKVQSQEDFPDSQTM